MVIRVKTTSLGQADFSRRLSEPAFVMQLLKNNGDPDLLRVVCGNQVKTIINNHQAIIELTKKQLIASGSILRGLPRLFTRSAGKYGILAAEGQTHLDLRTEYLQFFRFEKMNSLQEDFINSVTHWLKGNLGKSSGEAEIADLAARAICIGIGLPLEAKEDILELFAIGLKRLDREVNLPLVLITFLLKDNPDLADVIKLPFTLFSNLKLQGLAKKIIRTYAPTSNDSLFAYIKKKASSKDKHERVVAQHMFIHIVNATTTFQSTIHSSFVEMANQKNKVQWMIDVKSQPQSKMTDDWMKRIFGKAAPVEITGRLLTEDVDILIDDEKVRIEAGELVFCLGNAVEIDYNFAFFFGMHFCLAGNNLVPVFLYSIMKAIAQGGYSVQSEELNLIYGAGYVRKPTNWFIIR